MARGGATRVTFNQAFFDQVMKTPKVRGLLRKKGREILNRAKATAPYDTGDYQRGLVMVESEARYRPVVRVVGQDPKTLLIEARTGNLARSLKGGSR